MDKFKPTVCEHCGQTTDYLLAIDRGISDILIGFIRAVKDIKSNCVHPIKMCEQGYLTVNQVKNLSRARFHGLIARIDNKSGWWCLTTKGGKFLRGDPIPKFCVVSKSLSKQVGYWQPEIHTIDIKSLVKIDSDYWEIKNFDVVELPFVSQPALSF